MPSVIGEETLNYCSNCGTVVHRNQNSCPDCGLPVVRPRRASRDGIIGADGPLLPEQEPRSRPVSPISTATRREPTIADLAIRAIFTPLYVVGIIATLANPEGWFVAQVSYPLVQLLGSWLGPFVTLPLFGLFWVVPAFGGAFCFNASGKKFQKLRLTSSFLLLGVMYGLGNMLKFRSGQWWWLHGYMLSQLATSGIMVAELQLFNSLAFALFLLAAVGHARAPVWALLDYIWAAYFVAAALIVQFVPVQNSWDRE